MRRREFHTETESASLQKEGRSGQKREREDWFRNREKSFCPDKMLACAVRCALALCSQPNGGVAVIALAPFSVVPFPLPTIPCDDEDDDGQKSLMIPPPPKPHHATNPSSFEYGLM